MRLNGEPWELRMVGSDSEATVATVSAGGPSEFGGIPTWTVTVGYSSSVHESLTHHYVCDAQDVWWVADMPVFDPDVCGCGVGDCAATGVSWDPPELHWWNEGIEHGLAWSESTEATDFYVTWFACAEDLRVFDRSDKEVEHVPGELQPVEVPAGTFETRELSVHYGHAAWYSGFWSAEVGYLVKEDIGEGDFVWELIGRE